MVHSPDFLPPENSQKLFKIVFLFCMALIEQIGDDSEYVVCFSLLPYGTGICHDAFI